MPLSKYEIERTKEQIRGAEVQLEEMYKSNINGCNDKIIESFKSYIAGLKRHLNES